MAQLFSSGGVDIKHTSGQGYSIKTPWFEGGIDRDVSFLNNVPQIDHRYTRPADHGAFLDLRKKQYVRMYTRTISDLELALTTYGKRLSLANNIMGPILDDYDKQVIMPSTCANSVWKASSTDLDNVGSLRGQSDVEYDALVEEAVIGYYRKFIGLSDYNESSLSMTRAKGLGYPFIIPGKDRFLNDIFLAFNSAIVTGAKANFKTDTLSSLYRFFQDYHGAPFAMEANRFQMTAKPRLLNVNGNTLASRNFEPRSRIINVEPKVSVMVARREIKRMLACLLNTPVHTQDRSVIRSRIDNALRRGWFVSAIDISKFDRLFGGRRGLQQVRIHSKILNDDGYLESTVTTFNTRFFAYAHHDVWEVPGTDLLKSGMGQTSLIGCTGNFTTTVAALARSMSIPPSAVIEQLGTSWDVLQWGDDTVIMFQDRNLWPKFLDALDYFKISATHEPTIKFLGSNYGNGEFQGTMRNGYSMGRMLQTQFFPERARQYPFSAIGYIARLKLMDHVAAKEVHMRMLPHFDELDLGPKFRWEDIDSTIVELGILAQKRSDQIGAIDDILQVMTHGLSSAEGNLNTDVANEFFDLLGVNTVLDVSDPVKVIVESMTDMIAENKIPRNSLGQIQRGVEQLASGTFSDYQRILTLMTTTFGLQWHRGSVVY